MIRPAKRLERSLKAVVVAALAGLWRSRTIDPHEVLRMLPLAAG